MTVTTWIGTPKALYRMARRGGEEWARLQSTLPADQREELSRLNESVDALAAELKEARETFERESVVSQERRRLREPWEEAKRAALDPSAEFLLATELVGLLHSEPTRKFRANELAKRLEENANGPLFVEAARLTVAAGFAERTPTGKLRAVGIDHLWAMAAESDRLDSSLAKMAARLRVMHVAPLWMLHEGGSAAAAPTEFQTVLNRLILRMDGLIWAGPGIVASATIDLETSEAARIWPPFAEKTRGTLEIERELTEAKKELKVAYKAAADELWAQREPAAQEAERALTLKVTDLRDRGDIPERQRRFAKTRRFKASA